MKSKAFFIFHLNLAFSSIEKESRKKVINNCYHPLLDLVEKNSCQIGIEMTGWTLEEINRLDPQWVTRFKKLLNSKSCELIGSGYSQLIGPLVPYNINFWNQKLGLETYLEILETQPEIVLVNEMAFSSSMVDIYNEFNFKGMIMDRDNVRLALGTKKLPTKAQGLKNNSIQILWSDSILFQKIQHYAHGDISKKDYLTYIESRIKNGEKILPLYCNDAEVFDYRPGRFSEERPTHSDGEWNRIFDLLESIKSDTSIEIISPTQVLEINKNKAQQLSSKIVSTQYPIPVKKQSKYNIARWSVTGRDDIWINTMCHRISKYLDDSKCSNKNDWKTLCQLWSSDYRTHITEKRWKKIKIKINETLKKYSLDQCNTNQKNLSTNNDDSIESVLNKIKSINLNIHNDNTLLNVSTKFINLDLNLRRGLAIKQLSFLSHQMQPCIGTVQHGFFEDISLGADFYSGNTTIEMPLNRSRATDLDRVDPKFYLIDDKNFEIHGDINTNFGNIKKVIGISSESENITFSYDLSDFKNIFGSIRLGFITLLDHFTNKDTKISFANGGNNLEIFDFCNEIDHSKPASTLVSSSRGLGATTGNISLKNNKHTLELKWKPQDCAVLPMLINTSDNNKTLSRIIFSMQEYDDTLKKNEDTINKFTLNITT